MPHINSIHQSRLTLRLTFTLCLAFFGCECSNSPEAVAPKVPAESNSSVKLDSVSPSVPAQSEPPAPVPPPIERCRAALLRGNYAQASQALEEMPAEQQKGAVWRYARALTAIEAKQNTDALRYLDNIEGGSAVFQEAVVDLQERAARQSEDLNLIQLFSREEKSTEQQIALGKAELKHKNPQAALNISEALLTQLRKQKHPKLLPAVLALAAQAATELKQKKRAAALYLELAENFPSTTAAQGSDLLWESLSKRKLSAKQRFKRAESLSNLGRISETQKELELLKKAPSPGVAASEVKGAIAWAWYRSRTDYSKAAQLFADAVSAGGKNKRLALYYQGKSLARADRDLEALKIYAQLAPLGGEYADHASYQLGRLNYILGDFSAAISAYQAYQKRFRRGRHQKETIRELAVALLGAKKPKQSAEQLEKLLKSESSARGRARLEELLGLAALQQGELKQAEALFRKVIKDRPLSFSALVAEKRLIQLGLTPPPRLAPSVNTAQVPVSVPNKQQTAVHEAVQLEIKQLDLLGLVALAEKVQRSEENYLKSAFPQQSGKALCSAYENLQAGRRQYQVAQWAAKWAQLKQEPEAESLWHWLCIYPRPYGELVGAEGKKRGVDPAFIYAIMRQESAFRPEVVSSAQAVGLMQIIGPTARNIAREIGSEYSKDRMSLPGVNIEYGAYYLEKLLKQFEGHLALAAAGYNAGPYAAARWLRSGHQLPLDLFVARIPYRETRNYVYRVLGNYARYRLLLNPEAEPGSLLPLELSMPQQDKKLENAY